MVEEPVIVTATSYSSTVVAIVGFFLILRRQRSN